MRRILVPLFLASVCLAGGVPAATNYAPVDVAMEATQVGEHSYYVEGAAGIATDNAGFISNAGFVITPQGVVVFDALGTPSLAARMLGLIRERTAAPIVRVVVSHYHADHIYGLQVFREQGADIIAPRGAHVYLDSPAASERLEERRFSLDPWVNEQTVLVVPDRLIETQEEFEVGGIHFRLNYLGSAHSDGDLTMYVVEDRVLYSGDIIFEGRVPFVGDADTRTWLETLTALETGQLKALIPGHGHAADRPTEAVAGTRDYLAYLREVMGDAVEEFVPFAEAYAAADWSRFEKLPAFEAANRRNAYQVFLSMEAESLGQ